ncbi:MAG: acetylxylan esterase [Kiritimatiellae bacterium]|nr:acetylxylan esterase [Kiritimatiellia bacterium]
MDTLISGFDQSTADAMRAFDVIQGVKGVDPEKTGVAGISLGAIRSGALCAYEPRIKRAYLSLVAGDLKKVILSARETRDLRGFIQKQSKKDQDRLWECVMRQDPLNAVSQLRKLAKQKRLRMVRAEKDQIMPPACSIALFNAVNSPESEICLKGMGHYSAMAGLSGIMDDLVAFFAADVPASWKPPVDTYENASVEMIGYLLKDLSSYLTAAPKEGCAHMVGLKTSFNIKGKEHKFDFELALGNQGRFKLTGTFPEVGYAGFGRGDAPWIIGGQKSVFRGTRSSDPDLTLASLIDPQALLHYRMALGLAAGAALSPDLIKNYAAFKVENGKNNTRILCLKGIKKKSKGNLRITFDGAGRYPLEAEWDVEGVKGRIDFTHWQINAASDNSIFEPSDDIVKQDVLQRDVLQMFASIFQFAVEYFE